MMNNQDRKIIEKLENAFYQIASQTTSQEDIERENIEDMKDLQKIMYYMEVRCAMKENDDCQNDEYMNEMDYPNRSYSNRYYNGGSAMYGRGNSYARGGYGRISMRRGNSYTGNGSYSRKYYDSEKENSINDLRQMLQMEKDPDKRSMLEGIMHVLENEE